jgi:uncharacterized membrane protein YbhN (UPF0104 family)
MIAKKKIYFYLKFLLGFAIIYFLITSIHISEIYNSLKKANAITLCFVVLFGALNLYLQYAKWKLICNETLNEFNQKKIIHSLLIGFSAGLITPMRIGEYWGRHSVISDHSFLKLSYSVVVEKFSLLFIELSVGGILSLAFIYWYLSFSLLQCIAITIVFVIFLVALIFILSGNFSLLKKIKRPIKLVNIIERYSALAVVERLLKNKLLMLSFLQFFCYLIQYVVLVITFSKCVDYIGIFLAACFIYFMKNFVAFITPGELGTREGVSVFTLALIGINGAAGFNAGISVFFINILIPSIVGTFFLLAKHDN